MAALVAVNRINRHVRLGAGLFAAMVGFGIMGQLVGEKISFYPISNGLAILVVGSLAVSAGMTLLFSYFSDESV